MKKGTAFVRNIRDFMILYLLVCTVGGFVSCARTVAAPFSSPSAVNGVLDLRDWDFEKKGIVNLAGQWNFYWNRFLSFEETAKNERNGFLNVPGSWKGMTVGQRVLRGDGYCTIHLLVRLPAELRSRLSIRIPVIGTAHRVWINEQLAFEAGKVGKTREEMVPYLFPHIYSPELGSRNEIHITMQISNFMDTKGGVWEHFFLGTDQDINEQKFITLSSEMMVFGGLFIMAVYHFGLFFIRKKDRSTLFFGLFCLVYAVRTLITEQRVLMSVFPSLPFDITYRAEYLTAFLNLPFFVSFSYYMFPDKINCAYLKITWIFFSVLCAAVLILPHFEYTHLLIVFEIYALLSIPYLMHSYISSVISRSEGAVTSLAGIIILAIGAVLDIMHNEHLNFLHYITPFTLFGFLFFQSYSLAAKFSKAFLVSENLAAELTVQSSTLKTVNEELLSLQKGLEEKVLQRGEELEISYRKNLLEIQKVNELERKISAQTVRQDLFVDIHDNLGAKLLNLSIQLNQLEPDIDAKSKIQDSVSDIMKSLRNHLLAFEDIALIEENFRTGFKNFLVRRYSVSGRKIELNSDPDFRLEKIPEKCYHHLFSILQELISNDLKYGKGITRWTVSQDSRCSVFQMTADSVYETSAYAKGRGHKTVQTRLTQINAEFAENLKDGKYSFEIKIFSDNEK